jgi:hypothetical protein
MNLRQFFTKKPVVRPETAKDVKTAVVMVDFSEWIDTLKRDYANATIRVKRIKTFIGETPAYVGNPIQVSNIEAATFDRILYELFGGGIFELEYWQGSHRIMMKNSKPQTAVTHRISVEGEPKQLGGRKAAIAQIAAQPKTLMALLLKQFDTPEGIAAVTAFATLAMNFFTTFKSSENKSGTFKDMIESASTLLSMMPAPPDEIAQFERYQKLAGMFSANKPPVNIGAGSPSFWDGLSKVAGQVLGTVIANAQQNNGGQKPGVLQSQESQSPGLLAEATPGSQAASASSPSPAASPTPQQMFVNSKIMSIQAGMQAKLDPLSIANEIWSLLVFIIDRGIVDDNFVQKLYADPDSALDQIIATYAPESASYPKLAEVKRVVVGYLLEEPEEEREADLEFPRAREPEIEKSVEADSIRVVEFPKREAEEGSEGTESQDVRTEPVVIQDDAVVLDKDGKTGEFVPVPPGEEQVTISAED